MISFDAFVEDSNLRVRSFQILQDTKCKKQIDDRTFVEETRDIVRRGEVYDGEIVVKGDGNMYIFLGYDARLGYEVYIPLVWNSNSNRVVNITEA